MRVTTLRLTPHEATLVPDTEMHLCFSNTADVAEEGVKRPGCWPGVAPGDHPDYWLDMADATRTEWTTFLDTLQIPESDREVCLETRRFPQAEALTGTGLALRLPTRNAWKDGQGVYINVVLLKHILITQHDGELLPLDKVRRHLLEGDRPDIATTPGLLLYLLHGLMESGINDMLQARASVEQLEKLLESSPAMVKSAQIRRLKHDAGHLAGQTEEQLFCLTLLRGLLPSSPELAVVHVELMELVDSLNHLLRALQRLESRIAGTFQQIDARLRNRTDQRLRILTLFSAIFMPLTFIAGVYGMNFEHMPAQDTPWGYWLVMGGMLALCLSMVFFFWRRGWFK